MVNTWWPAWLYEHPGIRRAWLVARLLWAGALLALLCAPPAAAQPISGALSWTGLHDSYGVPVGAYYVSVVPMLEALREQGPDFTMTPDSWGPALASKVTTALTYTQLAGWLAFECAALIAMCAVAIWFVKFALSTAWLAWLAAIANPVVTNISVLVDRLYILPGALLVCCLVGGVIALTKGVGRGVGVICSGFVVVALIGLLLRDPVSEMVGDNGVLGIGRTLGFTIAQGAANNGPLAPGGSSAQLDTLTSWLADVLVRQQIQMINFGQVIDDIPGCAQVWNAALLAGQPSGPAHAVGGCAPPALAHAQQLDTGTVGLFAVVIVVVFAVVCALVYVGCEVIRVGFKAFWNLLAIVPIAAVGVAPGPTRRFAGRTAVRLVIHGVEMLVATAGLGIIVILMSAVTRGTIPGTIGITHPMARLLVMLLVAVGGAAGFRHLLHAFGDRGIPGPGRVGAGALATVVKAGSVTESAYYAQRGLRSLRSRLSDTTKTVTQQGSEAVWTGPQAPGRRGHPPTGGIGGRPPGGPDGGNIGPRNSRPAGAAAGMSPAQANTAAHTSRSGAAVGKAATAGRVAAAVGAPEVAGAAVAAKAVASHVPVSRGGRAGGAPGRGGDTATGAHSGEQSRPRRAAWPARGRGANGTGGVANSATAPAAGQQPSALPRRQQIPPGRTPPTPSKE